MKFNYPNNNSKIVQQRNRIGVKLNNQQRKLYKILVPKNEEYYKKQMYE